MKPLIVAIIALTLFTPSADAQEFGKEDSSASLVSMTSLLANPKGYEGDTIKVIGVLQIEFEGDELCSSKEALEHFVTMNCLALRVDPDQIGTDRETLAKANGEYVLVEGVFHPEDQGLWPLFSGALQKVHRIVLWERVQGVRSEVGARQK